MEPCGNPGPAGHDEAWSSYAEGHRLRLGSGQGDTLHTKFKAWFQLVLIACAGTAIAQQTIEEDELLAGDGVAGDVFGIHVACDGVNQADLDDYLANQTHDPMLVPGAVLQLQAWYRDPPDPASANFSDAMAITLVP